MIHDQTYGIGEGMYGSTGGVGEGHSGVEGTQEHSHPRISVISVLTRASGNWVTRLLDEKEGECVTCLGPPNVSTEQRQGLLGQHIGQHILLVLGRERLWVGGIV